MIRISCTKCKNVLMIDDAFAGGVCRCQYCGTIQMVPAHLKGSGGSNVAPSPVLPPTPKPNAPSTSPPTSSSTTPPKESAPKAARPNIAPAESGEPVAPVARAVATKPPAAAPRKESYHSSEALLLKLGVVIAFILFLVLIVVILLFKR